jgi:ABC-2 type transport system ATP-binding protein
VVDHGIVVADDTPDRLKATYATDRMRLGFGSSDDALTAAARVESAHHDARVQTSGKRVTVEMTGATFAVQALLHDLAADGVPASAVEVSRPTLDDVFLNLTGRSLREGHTTPGTVEPTEAADAADAAAKQEVFA